MTTFDQRGQQIGIQNNFVYQIYSTNSSGRCIPLFKPPRAPHFTNRVAELEKLLGDLHVGKVITICGPGGIGKTALTAEVVWALAPEDDAPEEFPDGIIFHSFCNQPNVDIALETIALALGDEAKPTPLSGAQRALSVKKVLLVLDSTEKADDLSKILAITAGCGVIVTSQTIEDALADWEDIRPLPTNESANLLQAWCQSLKAEQDTVQKICELMGNLPLAVRLAGRYLFQRRMSASCYLEWLKSSPLEALDQGKRREQSIPVLLASSLDQVSDAAKKTLALVGQLSLAPFSSDVISESFAISDYAAEDRLGQLVNWGLLDAGDNRYQVTHALIHTYAQKHLLLDDKTFRRLIAYYLAFTQAESKKGVEGYLRLDQERPHLLSLVKRCVEQAMWESAIQLVLALNDYLNIQGYTTEWITLLEIGINAAQQFQDRQKEGSFISNLGAAYFALGQVERTIEYLEQALAISREIGHRQGEGSDLGNLGLTYHALGQVEEAIEYHEQALAISREIGHRQGEGNRLGNLGNAYRDLGQVEKAIEYYEQALEISRENGYRQSEGNQLSCLAIAYHDLGRVEKVKQCFQDALLIFEEIKSPTAEQVRRWLADLE